MQFLPLKRKTIFRQCAWVAVLVLVLAVQAQADDPLKLSLEGHLVVTYEENGKEVVKLLTLPEVVESGDIIQYDIKGENTADKPLKNIRAEGKVPDGTIYIENSARCTADSTMAFSHDYGETFSTLPLTVKVRDDSGAKTERVISPDEYTNVRFVIKELAAGEKFTGSYGVVVK